MAVLIEAVSVIVRKDATERVFGGWETFKILIPNNTFCFDDDLYRIGFMAENDASAFVEGLGGRGLNVSTDDPSRDVAIADQLRGLLSPCDWLDCVAVEIAPKQRIAAGILRGSTSDMLSCPAGWSFDRSLSSRYGFARNDGAANGLRFLRHEKEVDVYWNELTNEEVFVARSGA